MVVYAVSYGIQMVLLIQMTYIETVNTLTILKDRSVVFRSFTSYGCNDKFLDSTIRWSKIYAMTGMTIDWNVRSISELGTFQKVVTLTSMVKDSHDQTFKVNIVSQKTTTNGWKEVKR